MPPVSGVCGLHPEAPSAASVYWGCPLGTPGILPGGSREIRTDRQAIGWSGTDAGAARQSLECAHPSKEKAVSKRQRWGFRRGVADRKAGAARPPGGRPDGGRRRAERRSHGRGPSQRAPGEGDRRAGGEDAGLDLQRQGARPGHPRHRGRQGRGDASQRRLASNGPFDRSHAAQISPQTGGSPTSCLGEPAPSCSSPAARASFSTTAVRAPSSSTSVWGCTARSSSTRSPAARRPGRR